MANHKRIDPHTIACFRISKKIWAKFARLYPNKSEKLRDYIDKEIENDGCSKNESRTRK